MDDDADPDVSDTTEDVECLFSFAKPSTPVEGGRNTDGEDDSASSVPTTCHDTNQWEHLMREVHGCRQFDDEDECSASATCHDTVKLEHAVTEIDRCVHSDDEDEYSALARCHDTNPHEVHVCSNVMEQKLDVFTGRGDLVHCYKGAINKAHTRKFVTAKKKAWRGYYCCVPLCHNSSGSHKERSDLGLPKISFHSFPKVNSVKRKQWIHKIRRDPGRDFVINERTKVCSEHFKPDDFIFGNYKLNGGRRRLKESSIPSIFAWSTGENIRTSLTSQKALHPLIIDNSIKQIHNSEKEIVELEATEVMETLEEPNSEEPDSIQDLQKEVLELKTKLQEAESKLSRCLFRLENIKDNDTMIKFYTGFSDYETLLAFYQEVLEADALVMRQWSGRRSESHYDDLKVGPSCKLPLLEQFFLTLVRLRLGLLVLDVANRFGISQASVSRITNTWINLMYHNLKSIETFPSWHVVKKYMPEAFKKDYPNTRIIIDATEFSVERPSSLVSQASTFSSYKNRNTIKVLIGITPSGAISFVSEAYEGSISDRQLFEVCGLLEKLEPGDEIMADKGFLIQDLLIPRGIRLNIPPFLQSNNQMPASDVFLTKKIARLRVHVERAIGRVKEFRILQDSLPATMWDSVNELIYVCCMLTNFGPPLVC